MATIQDLGKVAYFNKGMYNSETNYEINDVVSYNGSSYVSLLNNNQGNLPTNATYWSVVALKGDKGDTGKPFVIEKTYESIEDMVADYDNMQVNDYVMIQGNIEEEENATLWTKTETEVSPYKWVYLADFSGASGITGATPNIQIGTVTEGNEPAVTRRAGSTNENPILDFVLKTGAKGETGETGKGIASIVKTGTSGLVDTYTITFTNGNTTTFDVTNGKGIDRIEKTATVGNIDTYTIYFNDNSTSTFEVANGEVTKEELQEEVDRLSMIYNLFPTTSDEDTEMTLDGTGEVKLKKIGLKGNTSQKILSDEYTELDYITSDGNSYIDTGKSLGDNFKIETKFIHNQQLSAEQPIISTYANLYAWFNVYIASDDQLKFYAVGNHVTANPTLTIGNINTLSYSRNSNKWVGTLNGEEVTFDKTTPSSNPTTFKIFARGDNVLGSYVSIYRLKLFENNILTMDLIPCYRNSDNVIGMYDIVNNIFYTNSGTGNFTYGSVAPNPEYPIPVQVVTGDNEVKIKRKNLFDIDTITGFYQALATYSNGLVTTRRLTETNSSNIIPNFSSINLSSGTYYISMEIRLKSGSGSFSKINDGPVSWEEITKPTLSNIFQKYVYRHTYDNAKTLSAMLIQFSNSANAVYEIKNIMISTSSDTTYQPYQSASYPISLGEIELCKIGDYQDRIYKDSGKWYLEKKIGKLVLDGSETWNGWGVTGARGLTLDLEGLTYSSGTQMVDGYSSHFKPDGRTNVYNNVNDNRFSYNGVTLWIRHNSSATLADFKTWLSTHNTIVYYVLATPTVTEITDTTLIEQLDNLENAYSYDTQTNITQTNDDMPFILDVEALMSLKGVLN